MQSFKLLTFVALLLVMILISRWLFTTPVSHAATFTIPCDDVPALINAIATANSNGAPDTIELAAGCTYTLTAVDNTSVGPNGLPVVVLDSSLTNTLTINGNGATIERATGSPPFRFLRINGTSVTINDLTFRNGNMDNEEGGAILANNANLTLNRVAFENNQAKYDGGAVVARSSELTLDRAVFENNRALTAGSAEGGALYTVSAKTTITNSIFRNNRSEGSGGAITFRADGPVDPATVTGTTFSGNQTKGEGGAIAAYHEIIIRNSTFSGNGADGDGGALFSDLDAQLDHVTITRTETGGDGALFGNATLHRSLIAGNTDTAPVGDEIYPDIATGDDYYLSSIGYNLIGNVGDYDFDTNTTGDQYGDPLGTTTPDIGATESSTPIDPLLAPLADNGGPTPTHALFAGSPALDQIPETDCSTPTDQRGVARPQPTGGACDIGAFEGVSPQQAYLPLIMRPGQPDLIITSIEIIPNQTTFTAGQPIEIRVTVRNIGSAPAGPFWVDLYLNPDRPPQINDLWHNHCTLSPCFGVAWGVTHILQPDEQITLSTNSGYDTLRTYWLGWLANGTTTIYALADSWNVTGVTGAVFESDETNNRGVRDGLVVGGTNPPAPPWTPAYFARSAQSLLLPARPAYARSDRNAPR